MFVSFVDNFVVGHIGKEHMKHLIDTLNLHYDIAKDWTGEKCLGIDLQWDCANRVVHLSMKAYLKELLIRFNHLIPSKP